VARAAGQDRYEGGAFDERGRAVTAAGLELDSVDGIAEELARIADIVVRTPKDTRQIVASLTRSWPESRHLKAQDPDGNSRKVRNVVGLEALTAAGGICPPLPVDFSIPIFGSAVRPVRDALPAFGADRGGIRFVDPTAFTISAVSSGVAIWTAANDANPGGANTGPGGSGTGPTTKPSVEINCASEISVTVEAITQQATLGNMRARFNPEQAFAVLQYLAMAHSSTAESELLRQMVAGSTAVTTAKKYGASRDLLSVIDLAVAGYRDRRRIPPGVRLRAVLPHWSRELIRIDLARAAFPYEGDAGSSLAVTDAQIDAYFAARGVTVTFAMEPIGNTDQAFAAQSSGALNPFPLASGGTAGDVTVRWLLFAEGTFQFLDGGVLDLGVVRDSSLNAVNKLQVFSETFEAVAKRGIESLYVTSTVSANGATSGTVTPVGTF
jgi:hypothetical protein